MNILEKLTLLQLLHDNGTSDSQMMEHCYRIFVFLRFFKLQPTASVAVNSVTACFLHYMFISIRNNLTLCSRHMFDNPSAFEPITPIRLPTVACDDL